MKNDFEKKFNGIAENIINAVREYAGGEIEKLYVYGIIGGGLTYYNFAFRLEGKVVLKHKLNEIDNKRDVSTEKQKRTNNILFENFKEMKSLFKEQDKKVPETIEIIYNAESKEKNIVQSYDSPFGGDDEKTLSDCFMEWLPKK